MDAAWIRRYPAHMKVGDPIRPSDLATVHVAIVQGKLADEIDADNRWPSGRAAEVHAALLAGEQTRQANMRSPDWFADYTLRSRSHMKALDDVYNKAMGETPNPAAAVAAIRAKHDILDRTIARGQDLGQISKRPQEHTVLVGTMDDAALQELVVRRLRELQDLSTYHGGKTILDITPEPVRQPALTMADRDRVMDAEIAPTDPPRPPPPLPPSRGQDRAVVAPPAPAVAGSAPYRPTVVRRKAIAPTAR